MLLIRSLAKARIAASKCKGYFRIPDALASIGEFGWKMMLWENLNLNLALNHNLRGIKIKITIKKKATTPFPTNQVVCIYEQTLSGQLILLCRELETLRVGVDLD